MARFDERTTIVNSPRVADQILLDRRGTFDIPEDLLGRHLSHDERDTARYLKPLLNPVLRRARTQLAAPLAIDRLFKTATHHAGEWYDATTFFEAVTGPVTTHMYFGDQASAVEPLLHAFADAVDMRVGHLFTPPESWPSPSRRRMRNTYEQLSETVENLLKQRRATSHQQPDIAAELVALANDGPRAASSKRLAQLLIGSLLAAQKVPAAAASWAVLELARNPDLKRQLRAEARKTRQGDNAATRTGRTVPHPSPLATAIVLETVRLHPPNWLLRRTLRHDAEVGGYRAPRGHAFLISPYALNRDPSLFPNPDQFRTERWHQVAGRGASYSFGLGPHACPGTNIALSMLASILVSVTQELDYEIMAEEVHADPRATLRPRNLRIRIAP